ncbi:hypothetical protein ABQG65_08805 [Yersinia alsatica]|uniref:hypothetical protein n=1 Tax=Yersinia alsatica TaxID=2890317 RepID=UPI0032EAE995
MDIELTGNETSEELEDLIDGLGDVEVAEITAAEPVTTIPTNDPTRVTDTTATNTGDSNSASRPDTDTVTPAIKADEVEKPKGILSKDGQHVIPYDVLVAERTEKQRLNSANQQTAAELAETKRQLAALTHQINAAGMQPVPLPEKAQVTPEQINGIRDDFPEMAAMFDTLVQKIDYLQQGQSPAVTSELSANPVADAMEAVPDLKSWQTDDPDRFTLAVHIDSTLQNDPLWKDKSLAERFTEVAKRTRSAYGEVTETVVQPPPPQTKAAATSLSGDEIQRAAAEKLAAVTTANEVPNSPSELGVTTTHTASPLEQVANASPAQLQALFAGMTDEQIDTLLEQAIP